MTPRHVGIEQRTTAELFGEVLSLLLEKRDQAEMAEYQVHTKQLCQQLASEVAETGAAVQSVVQLAERAADIVPCDGFVVYIDGLVKMNGDTPTAEECEQLRGFLDQHASTDIYETSEMGAVWPHARGFADRAAGMLVLPISKLTKDYLVFFRREMAHAVTWAGRPNKLVVVAPDGPRLSPRKSFAAWREIVRGQSVPWTPAELAAAETMRVTLLEIVLQRAGATEANSRAATQKQELLIAELNHRVRNILALIRSLVMQSRMSANDVDTFATVLGDRVHALARAHDQITAKNWGPGSLAKLIETEAAAFLGVAAARVSFTGPGVLLQPQAFSTMALVIHELMTNAAKHGALASEAGQVAIVWRLDHDGTLALDWLEQGGSEVIPPTRRGFGSTIIHRSIPHELGGEAALDYAPDGLRARFTLPARHTVLGDDPMVSPAKDNVLWSAIPLSGPVLLVEDNAMIALEAEDLLIALGAQSVLVASDVSGALIILKAETPSFALLDVNLGLEMSWPIATRLRELGIRYAFATGYGDGIDFPLEHRQVPVITKPYTHSAIADLFTAR